MAVQVHIPPRRLMRIPRRADAFMVPRPIEGKRGQFAVDGTWGTIQPLQLAPGVRTVGELEVVEHIERGLPLVDSRLPRYLASGTIPTAVSIPHPETMARLDEFDPDVETVVFCNGPQCAASPDAIEQLLAGGYPADRLLYYRGGIHDWVTLGLPLQGVGEELQVARTAASDDNDVSHAVRPWRSLRPADASVR